MELERSKETSLVLNPDLFVAQVPNPDLAVLNPDLAKRGRETVPNPDLDT